VTLVVLLRAFLLCSTTLCPNTFLFEASDGHFLGKRILNDSDRRGDLGKEGFWALVRTTNRELSRNNHRLFVSQGATGRG
jgi:hypothetical protein